MNTYNIERYVSLQKELKMLKIYLKSEGLLCGKSKDYIRVSKAISRLAEKMGPAYLKVAESYHPVIYSRPNFKTNSKTNLNTNILKNTSPSAPFEQKLAVEKNSKTQINSLEVIKTNLPAVGKVLTNFKFYSSFSFICTVGICTIYFLMGSICFYYSFYFLFHFLFDLFFYLSFNL